MCIPRQDANKPAEGGGIDADGLEDREPAVRFAVRRAGVAQQ
jgi:hypothetical protein